MYVMYCCRYQFITSHRVTTIYIGVSISRLQVPSHSIVCSDVGTSTLQFPTVTAVGVIVVGTSTIPVNMRVIRSEDIQQYRTSHSTIVNLVTLQSTQSYINYISYACRNLLHKVLYNTQADLSGEILLASFYSSDQNFSNKRCWKNRQKT